MVSRRGSWTSSAGDLSYIPLATLTRVVLPLPKASGKKWPSDGPANLKGLVPDRSAWQPSATARDANT